MANPFADAWRDLRDMPPASLWRRVGLAALLTTGITMTAMGSIFLRNSGPIPFKWIPDLRVFALVVSGMTMGLWASGGGARRRAIALWGVVGYVVAFHLEEALVHWIGPFPGSITGTPVGLVGTSGSILALVAVLLMHVEVESTRLGRDLARRGASETDARVVAARLASLGARRIASVALGVAGLGALVVALVPAFGYDASGGPWVLPLGGVILLGLAVAVAKLVPGGGGRRGEGAETPSPRGGRANE